MKKIIPVLLKFVRYDYAVSPALILETISRLTGNKELIPIVKRIYAYSRDIRAVEYFLKEYQRTGDIQKALKRVEWGLKKHYK